jgi:hypothetical protein
MLVDYPLMIHERETTYTESIVRTIFTNCYAYLKVSDELDVTDTSTIGSESRY